MVVFLSTDLEKTYAVKDGKKNLIMWKCYFFSGSFTKNIQKVDIESNLESYIKNKEAQKLSHAIFPSFKKPCDAWKNTELKLPGPNMYSVTHMLVLEKRL